MNDKTAKTKQPPPSRNTEIIQQVFSRVAPRYELANHLLSGGLDFLWRQFIGRLVRKWEPATILDLATGTGDLAVTLGKYCPTARIIGADFSLPMLRKAQEKKLPTLVCADGMNLPFADAAFDVVTVAFGLRNMADYPGAVQEAARVLRPGGHYVVLDFSLPRPPLRGIYRLYLHHVLPPIAALATGARDAYEYLGESIENFPAGDAMIQLLRKNGFAEARCRPLSCGIVSVYWAKK